MHDFTWVSKMLKHKFTSESGASILIALIFLLLCTVAGSVILTAASTASGRVHYEQQQQQMYYSVLSATRLFQKELEGQRYSRYQVVSPNNQVLDKGHYETPGGNLSQLLLRAADHVFQTTTSYSRQWEIEVSEEVIETVSALFCMDKNYNITITCFKDDVSFQLSIPAIVWETTVDNDDEVLIDNQAGIRHTLTVTWGDGEIER